MLDQPARDQFVRFETELAGATLALAEGLQARGDFHCRFLFDAATEMRNSVVRLEADDLVQVGQHQTEALNLLIKARSDFRWAFARSPSAAALQQFDREQIQRLRKPKSKEEQTDLLASKLEAMAVEERLIYETLGGEPCEQGSPSNSRTHAENAQKEAAPFDRGQLEQRQHDLVQDAYEAQQGMANLEGMTELAEQRMTLGTQRAEEASGALARGETDAARNAARDAGDQFRELARQVAALSAAELAAKIAVARDLTADLAERERGFGDLCGTRPSNAHSLDEGGAASESGSTGPESDRLADNAASMAESGRSIQDVLDALRADQQANGEQMERIASALEHAGMDELVGQMYDIERRVRDGESGGIQSETRVVVDRLRALAHELDAIHSSIVAPQLAELLALEQRAAQLRERLAGLRSELEITQWHLDAQQMLLSVEEASGGNSATTSLRQTMADAGWGASRHGWGWELKSRDASADVAYVAPPEYLDMLTGVIEVVQRHARELLLRDLSAAGQEAVPPQYEKLVDRYFQVLSLEPKVDEKP